MHRLPLKIRSLGLAALLAAALPGAASAQVTIAPTVLFDGTFYDYSYRVTNNAADTLALTTFNVAALPNAILNPIAPAGFQISFDSGLGLVSFLEDADPNTPGAFDPGTTVSGFSFQSKLAPASSPFEALTIVGDSITGTTLAPTGTAVPEPGFIAMGLALAVGMTTTLFRTRRERKIARS